MYLLFDEEVVVNSALEACLLKRLENRSQLWGQVEIAAEVQHMANGPSSNMGKI